jgi:hypothetical protein
MASVAWMPSPKNRPVTITWTCGGCGHIATFGPDETVYEDDPRFCEHGPKQPRHPDGTLIYGHAAIAHRS